ncbi:MAG TPA: hypothetical protein DD435_01985 [Cyanobacteria bacterium UBA8530]|nr:hypothetical protein [Cyanobacteria bacterium UBA8530]
MRIQNNAPVYQPRKAVSAQAQTDGAAPVVAQNAPVATASALSGITGFFKKAWTGVVDFFKRIFGKKDPAETLTPDEAAIAKTYNLQATKQNVNAFLNEAKTYETNGTLGPGTANKELVTTLQTALKDLKYDVSPNGDYDQKTMSAVIAFKTASGMHQNYKNSDGAWAINEYATQDVLQKIMAELEGK